jgi:hypothetical protein
MTTTRTSPPALGPREFPLVAVSTTATAAECLDGSEEGILALTPVVLCVVGVVATATSLADCDFDVAAESQGWRRKFDYTSSTSTTAVSIATTTTTTGYH